MADNNLLSRVRNSKFYRSVSNALDRDKDQPGFQFTAPKSYTRQAAQGYQIAGRAIQNNLRQRVNQNPANAERAKIANNVNTAIGSFGRKIYNDIKPFGTLIGTALQMPIENTFNQIDQQSMLRQFNNANTPKQNQMALDRGTALANRQRMRAQQLNQIKLRAPASAARTGLYALSGGLGLPNLGLSMGISGGLNTLFAPEGQRAQALGEGTAEGVKYAGLNRLTSPIIDPVAGKFGQILAGKGAGPMSQAIGRWQGRAIGQGLGNVIEDELFTRGTEERTPTGDERWLSFLTAYGFNTALNLKDLKVDNNGYLKNKAGQWFDPETGQFVKYTDGVKKAQDRIIKFAGGGEFDSTRPTTWKETDTGFIRVYKDTGEPVGFNDPQGGFIAGPAALGFNDPGVSKFSSRLDQKPRFEIDDSGAKLIKNRPTYLNNQYALEEILDHPKLYEQYPELRNLQIKIDDNVVDQVAGTIASYNPQNKTVTIPERSLSNPSTLLHEIQHAIQEIEGFARGGSPADFVVKRTPKEEVELFNLFKKEAEEGLSLIEQKRKLDLTGGELDDIPKKYERLSGELEARAVQRRMNITPEQRMSSDPYAAEAMATTGTTDPNDFITRFDGGTQASQPTKIYNQSRNINQKETEKLLTKELGKSGANSSSILSRNKLETPQNLLDRRYPSLDRTSSNYTTSQPTKGVEALIEEAKKYKSAEEFDADLFRKGRADEVEKQLKKIYPDRNYFDALTELVAGRLPKTPTNYNQGIKVFHGTDNSFKEFDPSKSNLSSKTGVEKGHIFFTTDQEVAGSYGKNIMERTLKPENPLIVNADNLPWNDVKFEGKSYNVNELAIEAEKRGYGSLIVENVRDTGGKQGGDIPGGFKTSTTISVFDKTKQQLTDIYNQANKPNMQGGFINFGEIVDTLKPKTRVDSQDIQTDKPLNTLTKAQVQKARARLIRTQTSEAKGRTFQTGEPVRGGSKIRTQASEKVGAGSQGPSSPVSITRDNKYSFNINKKRLNLDEEQSRQLDDVVRVMRPVLEKNKGKTLTKQEIIEAGRKADVLRDTVGREESKQFAESLQASRNLLRSQQSQVGITPEFLDQLEIVSSVAADAGRRLQSFNIGAEDITIKEKVLRDLINIGASVDEMLEAGRKVDWDNAEEVTRFYRKFKPATLADKLDEYRYTNMLSSPNTHIVNTFSNFLQTAVLAPIEKTIRGSLSFAEARLTGKEQEYFARQGVDYASGYWKSLPDAWGSFRKTLAGNGSLTKLETDRIPTSTSTIRKWYTTPLRLLEASDQFFRTMTKAGETESLKRQGITGARAAKMAEAEADYRTFRQAFDPNGDLGQNKVLQIWDKWNAAISNLRNVPGGKWIVPFLQTPTNILKQGVEYSPLGFATAPGAREPMTQLSKAIVGSTVFTGAYALANSGLTTWDAPTNSNERAEFYAAGLQPYSVKIGDKWVSYSKLGPLSYPIAMAAALKWAEENGADEGLLSQVGMTIGGTLGFFADQSYVRGIGDVIDAVRGDDYKRARGLANIPSQLVPYRAFMGWLARMVDPVYRKSSGGTVQAQIGKNIMSQIPFASKTLPAYETPFGGESERQFAVANNFSPLAVTQERPEEKEYYDARQAVRDEDKKLDKILTKIENGETDNLPKTDKNKILTDKAVEITKKKVEAGIEVTPEELNVAYLGKALTMPSGNRYEKSLRQSAMYEALGRIEDNEDLSDGQKQLLKAKIATEVGKTPEDIEMYSVAKQNVDTKTLYALDQIDKMQSTDELMTYLVRGRMPINGEILTSDQVLNNLVNEGIISKQLASDLKDLDFNEDGTLKKKVSSGGSKNNLTTARLKVKVDSIKAFREAQKRYFDNIMSVDPYQESVPVMPPKIDISRIKSIA